MADFIINSYFAKNGVPQTGLTPIIRIWEVNNTGETLIISNGSMVETGDGFYKYVFTDTNGYDEAKEYVVRSDANDITMSNNERYAVGSISVDQGLETANRVWEANSVDYTTAGTMGYMANQVHADTTQLRIDNTLQITLLELLLKYERNRTRIDKVNHTLTIYDDDGTTPLTVFDLKDAAGQPSIVEICERMP